MNDRIAEPFPHHGIFPMLYAFFGPDGALDRAAMRQQVEACIAGGAHGVAVLGLATEVGKLSVHERRMLVDWVAEDVAGRLPFAVTVAEPNVAEQVAFCRAARDAGAAFCILQPPAARGLPEIEYLRFFGAVADGGGIPLGIQHAPEFLGLGLSVASIKALGRNHANVRLIKGEAAAVTIRALIEETAGELAVFNGRAGLELTDNLRAGCAGMIPGVEACDVQARIYDLMRQGTPEAEAAAEALYRDLLPLVVFLMQSLETLLCYGKQICADRLGLGTIHPRAPSLAPSSTGLAWARAHAARLPRAYGAEMSP